METRFPGDLVKNAGALSWSDVDSGEAALVARCTAGDEIACAELVSTHQRMVYALALNLLGDRDEALDLSQEVFLRVFRTLSGFRGQSALRTWIYRIAVNQAKNRSAGGTAAIAATRSRSTIISSISATSNRGRTSCRIGCWPARRPPRRSGRRSRACPSISARR